jgi:ATP-binding cassette subfamily B protein
MSAAVSLPIKLNPSAAQARQARGQDTLAPSRQPGGFLAYRTQPIGFLLHYVRQHPWHHLVVLLSVSIAVFAAVSTQYGIKQLIDAVSHGPHGAGAGVWFAFGVLCVMIAADNLTWRIGGWMAARAFVAVTGDVRRDLFRHLTGHAPSYFAERLPGTLAGRISATANAAFQVETTTTWNVLPPTLAVIISITLISTVNVWMAGALIAISLALAVLIHRLAERGAPLHRDYAGRAASVDGELVDVISNIGVVRAFGATLREHGRVSASIADEMGARRRSLVYLERLRLIHAALTALLCVGLLGWGVVMWQSGHASPGDLVLICSLGFTILHSTRDLAVALVDLTQHVARLEEAIGALLVPHTLVDKDNARPLQPGPGRVRFSDVTFAYPGRKPVLRGLDLVIEPGQRVGLVGSSGAGKSTVLSLLQRFYDVQGGSVTIDGQDIRHITQESLREMVAVVPQDISMFHRSVMENIRYAKPEASEREIRQAAEMARCDFIDLLPEGYDTIVGDRGTKLSGGQRQRLAIARALLKDADPAA